MKGNPIVHNCINYLMGLLALRKLVGGDCFERMYSGEMFAMQVEISEKK